MTSNLNSSDTGRMNLTEIRPIKENAKANIKSFAGFPKAASHLALLAIRDEAKRAFLAEGLAAIGIYALSLGESSFESVSIKNVKEVHPNELYAFDFFVFDGEEESFDIVGAMKAGVVPVMPEKNIFSGILKEFNPMKFEGNGFFFKSENPFCMFEKVVSYLENSKFPEDRRILMKHVLETF